jgi:hypothetical protein
MSMEDFRPYLSRGFGARVATHWLLPVTFVGALWGSHANASPMRFSLDRICDKAQNCELVVIADGDIERDSVTTLRQVVGTLSSGLTVEFNSRGGDLLGGLKLGEYIRSQGLNTRVRFAFPGNVRSIEQGQPAECYSACALALMGGVTRTLDNRARLGVHALQNVKSENDKTSFANALSRYVDSMGINRGFIDTLLTAPTGRVSFINHQSAKQLAIDNSEVARLANWRIQATRSGALVGTVTEQHPNSSFSVTLGLTRINGDTILIVHLRDTKEFGDLRAMMSRLKPPKLRTGSSTIEMKMSKNWAEAKDGIQFWGVLSESDVKSMTRSPKFSVLTTDIQTEMGRPREMSFSSIGLDNLVAALRKP